MKKSAITDTPDGNHVSNLAPISEKNKSASNEEYKQKQETIKLTEPRNVPKEDEIFEEIEINQATLIRNLIGFAIFVALLILVDEIYLVGLIGMVLFVFLNPGKKKGKYHLKLSEYLTRVDYKLVYFFMCLFVLVSLMEMNGTIEILESQFEALNLQSVFWLSVLILLVTSLLSGFLDNAPVTIIFIPIIRILVNQVGYDLTPLIIAFILGINLGGNFLPQGSACDMMTLELSQKHCVNDLTYRKLTKVGGFFALLHIVLGIIYLALVVFVF
jgi:Na+/H+ antiporter NhaD/arsenite permease-like protein